MPHNTPNPPSASWWAATTKSLINQSLDNRPDIVDRLGSRRKRFVAWASRKYSGYRPDLDEYITEFNSVFYRRGYNG